MAMSARSIPFVKMHGCGNDLILLDAIARPDLAGEAWWRARVRAMCDRRRGIGADGVIVVMRTDGHDARAEVYNADGSDGGVCGNGLRMVAKLLIERGYARGRSLRVEMGGRSIGVEAQVDADGAVRCARADMGKPETRIERLPVDTDALPQGGGAWLIDGTPAVFVSMGNPHAVLFVDALPDDETAARLGSVYETLPAFPERMNIQWARVIERGVVEAITWERGAGATLACGTGACAIGVAGVMRGLIGPSVRVRMPGGVLDVRWDQDDGRVWLAGPVARACEGVWCDDADRA